MKLEKKKNTKRRRRKKKKMRNLEEKKGRPSIEDISTAQKERTSDIEGSRLEKGHRDKILMRGMFGDWDNSQLNEGQIKKRSLGRKRKRRNCCKKNWGVTCLAEKKNCPKLEGGLAQCKNRNFSL